MIVDSNKGKITFAEARSLDLGFFHYLWNKTLRENTNNKNADEKTKSARGMAELLDL